MPAARAHIGVVDRLFSRVGAADDLARGRSTFMVEMVETAAILNQATARSLVILDEIGRGTATFDGLSIAYACVEHLNAVNRSRALFATHFHELTQLAETLPRLDQPHHAGQRIQGKPRLPARGRRPAPPTAPTASRSQARRPAGVRHQAGAKSAGRSRGLAAERARSIRCRSFPMSRTSRRAAAPRDELREAVAALDPDAMSPREAHDALYALKRLAESKVT